MNPERRERSFSFSTCREPIESPKLLPEASRPALKKFELILSLKQFNYLFIFPVKKTFEVGERIWPEETQV